MSAEQAQWVGDLALTDEDFGAIATMVRSHAGIVLGDSKRDLVYGRLRRRIRTLGLASFAAYRACLAGEEGAAERVQMINAITTNLTGFFREPHHFAFLEDRLPEAVRRSGRRLRVWSAGCSSGEEPYSIAMSLRRAIPDIDNWDARILATDIDTDMVAHAAAGRYAMDRIAAIPPDLRKAYTHRIDDGRMEMDAALKDLIAFRPLNLLEDWPMQGKFDAIFCRNVVIYFDKPTQRVLFDRYADLLVPGGLLFIGHSETLFRVSERFQHLGRTIYRKLR